MELYKAVSCGSDNINIRGESMKIIKDNEPMRDITPEEIAEMERMAAEMPQPEPDPNERMTQIEAALIELAAMLAGGEV